MRPGDGAASDLVALEEPLEIGSRGRPSGCSWRTPGDDHRLALGFLFSEDRRVRLRVQRGLSLSRPGDESYGSALELAPGVRRASTGSGSRAPKRGFASNSACGVCGRRAVEDLAGARRARPHRPAPGCVRGREGRRSARSPAGVLGDGRTARRGALGPRRHAHRRARGRGTAQRGRQGRGGAPPLLAEAASGGPGPAPVLLTVSSRAGLEIVQKAARARIPVVATVSAPTSLAIELARAAGLTLAGFVRPGRMNVYAGAERLTGL